MRSHARPSNRTGRLSFNRPKTAWMRRKRLSPNSSKGCSPKFGAEIRGNSGTWKFGDVDRIRFDANVDLNPVNVPRTSLPRTSPELPPNSASVNSGRGRDVTRVTPPARIRTGGITAYGSYLGYSVSKR